ncbi:MAG: type II toxin-antitoxin system Phd/YefM family antitoxin [Fimbriimonadaceae bacterium]|nr:type II toxin-antitoxin system Phd/YefM family antitoxin [Fimbriimonadaceae bacterium]
MISVTVTDFKARCLRILDEVSKTGESVTVTKRGKPIAVVAPPKAESGQPYRLGLFAGRATIRGDLVEPLDVEWEVLS